MDRALVKLVLGGAPQRWLWIEPEIVDLDELPECSPLRQAIEAAEAERELCLTRRGSLLDRLLRMWLGLKRLCRDCLQQCFP